VMDMVYVYIYHIFSVFDKKTCNKELLLLKDVYLRKFLKGLFFFFAKAVSF
jgi:hypothetical protein